jgi:putative transposase
MIESIHTHTGASLRRVCQVLNLPRSSYYKASSESSMKVSDGLIGKELECVFRHHRRRYGYRRLLRELRAKALCCAPSRVRRLMKERGLKAIQPKNYIPRTSDGRANAPSPNLLANQPLPDQPNRVWAGDITFIPTAAGWRYLAVVIDLYSRRVVGWHLATHMRSDLVCNAFKKALQSRRVAHQAIFHSDRGSQYGSVAFRDLLKKAGFIQSMSRRANPYDNAWTESFIGTLKNEMLQNGCFENDEDAMVELFDYIESYYNHKRRHSSLGYLSPAQFENQLTTQN